MKEGFTLCLCDTSLPYRTIADSACTTYTQTTCPTGHWGNAATSKCVSCGTVDPLSALAPAGSTAASACICAAGSWHDPSASTTCVACDATLGKMPTGAVGATTEAAACKLSAFGILGTGVELGDASSGALVLDEQCITDGVGKHGTSEQATITAIGAGILYATGLFELYESSSYNYLTLKGKKYYGATPPNDVALSAGETFTWTSSSYASGVKEGFTLCLCDTSVPYRFITNSACATYTEATCPAGRWGDTATLTCVVCAAGKFGLQGSMTSEATACTGSCPRGRYLGTSATGLSSNMCADCPAWGSTTPAGSTWCVGALMGGIGWEKAGAGLSCDEACGVDRTCQVSQMNAVIDEATFEFANAMMKITKASEGIACTQHEVVGNVGFLPCAGVTSTSSSTVNCYATDGFSSTCNATPSSSSYERVCCCSSAGQNPTTLCPVRTTDCGNGTFWDPATTQCVSSSSGCPPGYWQDDKTANCVACQAPKFGAMAGMTSETSACNGSLATCAIGTYGASLTNEGMTACAECPPWGSATPSGSQYCIGKPLAGWIKAKTMGQSCNDVCAEDIRATTCAAQRMDAVNDEVRFIGVNTALKAGGGDTAGFACAGYPLESTDYAPYFSSNGECVAAAASSPSSCSASSPSSFRLCCCAAESDDSATLCPVGALDCSAATMWDQMTSRCLANTTKCPAGSWRDSSGAKPICAACSTGRFSSASGLTTDCPRCPSGRFDASSTTGKTGPVTVACAGQCPKGRHGNETAATSDVSCVTCSPGRYANYAGAEAECLGACSIGRFSSAAGQTSDELCELCGPFSVSLSGASACKVCASATFPDKSSATCIQCGAKLFHAFPGDADCTPCPLIGAECFNSQITIQKDWWLVPPHLNLTSFRITAETLLYPCLSSDSCLEPNVGDRTVKCATTKGYFGVLCGACDRDNTQGEGFFTRSGRRCAKCWDIVGSWFTFVGIGFLVFIVIGYLVAHHSFAAPKGEYSATVTKITVSYLQVCPEMFSTQETPQLFRAIEMILNYKHPFPSPLSHLLSDARCAWHLQSARDESV